MQRWKRWFAYHRFAKMEIAAGASSHPNAGETEDDLKGEEKEEAKENNEAARMWTGLVRWALGDSHHG
jgi:hypothetical protein